MTISEFRTLLGPSAQGLSDAEVERVLTCCKYWAAAIFEWWLRKRNGRLPNQDSRESDVKV